MSRKVISGRFIRTSNNKINKYMTSISNIYINKSDEYNSTYHRTIKMKPLDV